MSRRLKSVIGVLGLVLSTFATSVFPQSAMPENAIEVDVEADVIFFSVQHDDVSFLRLEIFDQGRDRVFDSGPRDGAALDWDLTMESGERAQPGTYFYVLQSWDEDGNAVRSQVGQVAVAPQEMNADELESLSSESPELARPLKFDAVGDFTVFGKLGVGTENPARGIHLQGRSAVFRMDRDVNSAAFLLTRTARDDFDTIWKTYVVGTGASGPDNGSFIIDDLGATVSGVGRRRMTIDNEGNFGINTSRPSAALEVEGTGAPDLLVLKSNGTAAFRVDGDGDVFAEGSYNCALSSGCFNAGQGADVAERIDSAQPLEGGDVVEIDPDHPVRFRKTSEAVSRRVAGVVSTSPAITLGNDFEAGEGGWTDGRPLLALAGRVPVKVTAEPHAITAGDLLVSSPIPGHAMRCPEAKTCIGAVLGKALERLDQGRGMINVQVMLR